MQMAPLINLMISPSNNNWGWHVNKFDDAKLAVRGCRGVYHRVE